MAVLWSETIDGNHYEVRTAGASIRLYRNGVTHTQWNEARPFAGSIWDLISLPALSLDAEWLRSSLILGFGAGAVGKQLKTHATAIEVVGVELDPIHLSIANGFFGCDEGFSLINADAVEWIEHLESDTLFDYIVDDLYAEVDGIPVRCVSMDVEWCRRLEAHLSDSGIIVLNLVEPDKLPHLPFMTDAQLIDALPYALFYEISGYENRAVAFARQPMTQAHIDRAFTTIQAKFAKQRVATDRYKRTNLRGN